MVEKLNPHSLGVTFVITALIFFDLVGYVWHSILGQPSILNLLYPGFWSNWTLMGLAVVACIIYSYAFGYVFALVYNWALKLK